MNFKRLVYFLIPLLAAGLVSALHFIPLVQNVENRIYDAMLRTKPSIEQSDRILLLNIDDDAIENIGVWPWSRDTIANGLITLREFQSSKVVLDIEYVNQSPLAVNGEVLNQDVPQVFEQRFSQLREDMVSLFDSLQQGNIPMADAEDFVRQLANRTTETKNTLLQRVQDISRDNDVYFGNTSRLHGDAYFTVNILNTPDPSVTEESRNLAVEQFAIENIENRTTGDFYSEAVQIRPVIAQIGRGAAGAGFPNVVIDEDGVRRRIKLVAEYQDTYFPQLAFSAVYDMLGQPKVVAKDRAIVLENAELPEQEPQDIRIPLDQQENMIIHWPRGQFLDTFEHMSYWQVELMQRQEERLLSNLRALRDAGTFGMYSFSSDPIAQYEQAESIKQAIIDGGDPSRMAQYRSIRASLFEEVGAFLESDTEQFYLRQIESALQSEELPEDQRGLYQDLQDRVPQFFSASRDLYSKLMTSRERLREHVKDSLIFIGYTGTGTTDLGVTPFDREYANVGTHASIANTILQQEFLDILPFWYSVVAAFLLALLAAFIIRPMHPLPSLLVGVGFVLAVSGAGLAFFLATHLYFPMLTPVLTVFLTFLVIIGIKFVQTAQERSFIRNAFSHYLSNDVISEIMNDPSKLDLGGEKKHLTAFFTDVKGFSSISEQLDPNDLVKLLNNYLTEMSNIILDLRGTIDKYEGDAIISFFGAPIEYEDHAKRACLAAVRMRKMERILNDHIVDQELSPAPLHTRIGINTGEIVVGNMGTAKKMDYTMMGHAVNLAARLEGVNKQYGTWVLVSDATKQEAGNDLVFRRLDRVRVVGVTEPVRLYELVEERSEASQETIQLVEAFDAGIERFEQRDWDGAAAQFQEAMKIRPDDGPAQFYAKRCKEFKRKPPPDNWDGAFNLSMK